MTTKAPKRLIALAAVLAAGAGCAALLFRQAGGWLVAADPAPQRIDVIFTFGGENARVAYSRELMERFPSAHWVLSDHSGRYERILSREGFDLSRVSFIDTCTHTISEVKGLADWLATHAPAADASAADSEEQATAPRTAPAAKPMAVALVSTPFHLRRIRSIAANVFRDTASVRLYYLPVPMERYGWTARDSTVWWRTKSARAWVGSELCKLIAYWLLFSWN